MKEKEGRKGEKNNKFSHLGQLHNAKAQKLTI